MLVSHLYNSIGLYRKANSFTIFHLEFLVTGPWCEYC